MKGLWKPGALARKQVKIASGWVWRGVRKGVCQGVVNGILRDYTWKECVEVVKKKPTLQPWSGKIESKTKRVEVKFQRGQILKSYFIQYWRPHRVYWN